MWSITLLVHHLLLLFLYLEGSYSKTFDIFLAGLSATSAQDILGIRRYCCTFTSLDIPGALVWHIFGIPWYLLHQLHHLLLCRLHLVSSGSSWSNLLCGSLEFIWVLSWRVTGSLWCAWFNPSLLGWSYLMEELDGLINQSVLDYLFGGGCFPSPSSLNWSLKYLLAWSRLLQNLAWSVFPVIAIGFPYDCHTGSMGLKFFQTSLIIIFDVVLFLVLSLLCIGVGE